MFGAVVGMDRLWQMFFPVLFSLLSQHAQHLEQSSVQSLYSIISGVVWGSPGVTNPRELLQGVEERVFKLTALVMV